MIGRPDSGVDRCGPGGQKNYVTNFAFTRIHGRLFTSQGYATSKYLPRYFGNWGGDPAEFCTGGEGGPHANCPRWKSGVSRAGTVENHARNRREKKSPRINKRSGPTRDFRGLFRGCRKPVREIGRAYARPVGCTYLGGEKSPRNSVVFAGKTAENNSVKSTVPLQGVCTMSHCFVATAT